MRNPLAALIEEGFPELDFAVLTHGFMAHGRDYALTIQDTVGRQPGTHSLLFTHVVSLGIETRVRDDVFAQSWDDVFLDYDRAADLEGYVWGVNWSLAYPGLTAPNEDAEASIWSKRLGKPMFSASLETDRFFLKLIYHSVRTRRESNDTSLVSQAIVPLRG